MAPTVRSKKVKKKTELENAKEVKETQPEEKMEVDKSVPKITEEGERKKKTRPDHIKDKHWRDVSNMTEKQKAKYFKSRAIRKCVKVSTDIQLTRVYKQRH